MADPFQASRTDGRSDRQVIFDLVEAADPDTLFTHDIIMKTLSEGLPYPVNKTRLYQAVTAGNTILLRERKRYLRVVRGQGYRVIYTSEAVAVALDKKGRAEAYIARGLAVLRDARLGELTPSEKALHEGQFLIMAGLHEATQRSERRHHRTEQIIADLLARMEKVEEGDAGKADENGDTE